MQVFSGRKLPSSPGGPAMVTPTFADYVELLFTLFERFWQQEAARSHRGRPFVYQQKALLVFFVVMQQRRTFGFKAQHRWLQHLSLIHISEPTRLLSIS